MTGLFIVSFFTLFAFRIIVGELLFGIHLPKRSQFKIRILLGIGAFWGIYFLKPNFYFWDIFYIGWYNVSWLVMFFVSILLMYFCFDISLLMAAFYGSASYAVENMLHNIFGILQEVCFGGRNGIPYYIVCIGITGAAYLMFYFVLIWKRQNDLQNIQNRSLVCFCLAVISSVNLLSWWLDCFGWNNLASRVCMAWIDLLMLSLQFGLFQKARILQENEIMQRVFKENEKLHEASKANIDLINRKCHDLKHQMEAMKYLGNDKDRKESINEIKEAVDFYDICIHTGNQALDTILTEKSWLCEKHGIHFSCMADGAWLDFMKPMDIYSLFGNLLDNGIESVLCSEDEGNREICLKVERKDKFLMLHMENYCSNEVKFSDGLPISTKDDDGYHGFGTKSIRYVVSHYHGELMMYQEEKTFIVNILFYL